MTRRLCTALVCLAIGLISGCSYLGLDGVFRDRSDDYRLAEELPPLQVPQGLEAEDLGEIYPIPGGGEVVQYQLERKFSVPRPQPVAVNESANEVRIQRLHQDSWILLAVPPAEAWPRVRQFLTHSGIPVVRADAQAGRLETAAFELSDSPGLRHQFRISLVPGVQRRTTEVSILHRQFAANSGAATTTWAVRSDDPQREAWLRTGLAETLASQADYGTASLLGETIGAAPRAELIAPAQGLPYIEMRMSRARAWASVGYALARDGFALREQQAEPAVYWVDFQDPAVESPGFWRRLFGANPPPRLSYRVTVAEERGRVLVRVAELDRPPLTQRETLLVLQRIRDNLT